MKTNKTKITLIFGITLLATLLFAMPAFACGNNHGYGKHNDSKYTNKIVSWFVAKHTENWQNKQDVAVETVGPEEMLQEEPKQEELTSEQPVAEKEVEEEALIQEPEVIEEEAKNTEIINEKDVDCEHEKCEINSAKAAKGNVCFPVKPGKTNEVKTPAHQSVYIHGLEIIGPYAANLHKAQSKVVKSEKSKYNNKSKDIEFIFIRPGYKVNNMINFKKLVPEEERLGTYIPLPSDEKLKSSTANSDTKFKPPVRYGEIFWELNKDFIKESNALPPLNKDEKYVMSILPPLNKDEKYVMSVLPPLNKDEKYVMSVFSHANWNCGKTLAGKQILKNKCCQSLFNKINFKFKKNMVGALPPIHKDEKYVMSVLPPLNDHEKYVMSVLGHTDWNHGDLPTEPGDYKIDIDVDIRNKFKF